MEQNNIRLCIVGHARHGLVTFPNFRHIYMYGNNKHIHFN